jgi:hypothetical protein
MSGRLLFKMALKQRRNSPFQSALRIDTTA